MPVDIGPAGACGQDIRANSVYRCTLAVGARHASVAPRNPRHGLTIADFENLSIMASHFVYDEVQVATLK